MNKPKHRKLSSILCVMVLLLNILLPSGIILAQDKSEKVMPYEVVYNDDKSAGTVRFRLDKANLNSYGINSIKNKADGTTIYQGEEQDTVDYAVSQNGKYEFEVAYYEFRRVTSSNGDSKVEKGKEQTTTLTVTVDGIQAQTANNANNQTQDNIASASEAAATSDNSSEEQVQGSRSVSPASDGTQGNSSSLPYLNFETAFNNSGVLTKNYDSNIYPINDAYFNIKGSNIGLGALNYYDPLLNNKVYNNQGVVLTSKNEIDFNYSFTLEGSLTNNGGADGLAFAFHNSKDFKAIGAGATFGVYGNKQAANGIILEVDGINNSKHYDPSNKGAGVGDYGLDYNSDGNGAHMAIGKLNENGKVEVASDNLVMTPLDNSDFGTKKVKLHWDVDKSELSFEFGNKRVVTQFAKDDKYIENFKNNNTYYTIGNAINTAAGGRPIEFSLTNFSYDGFDPNVTTKLYGEYNDHVIPGETVTVHHELTNNIPIPGNTKFLKSRLYIDDLYLNDANNQLNYDNIKVGYDPDNLKSAQIKEDSSKNKYIDVELPEKDSGKTYYVEYTTKVDAGTRGETDTLHSKVSIGIIGMNRLDIDADIAVWNAPDLYVLDNGQKSTKQFLKTASLNTGGDNALWGSPDNKTTDVMAKLVNQDVKTVYYKLKKTKDNILEGEQITEADPEPEDKSNIIYYTADGQSFPTYMKAKTHAGTLGSRIIGVRIKVRDSRDPRLVSNTVTRYITEDPNAVINGDTMIYSDNGGTLTISETELSTYKEAELITEFSKILKVKGYQIKDDSKLKDVTVTFDPKKGTAQSWINAAGYAEKNVGEHEAYFNAGSLTYVGKVTVTENTASIDDGKNEVNGTTGYIVIPRRIELKRDGRQLTAQPKVFMAGYQTTKEYTVYVDKEITITNGDTSRDVNIYSGDNETTLNGEKVANLGVITPAQTTDNNPLTFNMTTMGNDTLKKVNIESYWEGYLTFYFEQVPGTGND